MNARRFSDDEKAMPASSTSRNAAVGGIRVLRVTSQRHRSEGSQPYARSFRAAAYAKRPRGETPCASVIDVPFADVSEIVPSTLRATIVLSGVPVAHRIAP